MNCYPFIEAEKSQRRNVKRARELMKVSRAAYYAARKDRISRRAREDAEPLFHARERDRAEHSHPGFAPYAHSYVKLVAARLSGRSSAR